MVRNARARSWAPTTRRPSPRCSRRRAGCSPRTGRTPGSSLLFTRAGGGRARGRVRVRPHAPRARARVRLRPGGADRHGDPRRAVVALARGDVPRPRRPRRACTPTTAAPRSPPRRARSRRFRLGRVDEDSTANVGTIRGGTATNIVPEWCTFEAEARSHDETKLGRPGRRDAERDHVRRHGRRLRGRDARRGRATAGTALRRATTPWCSPSGRSRAAATRWS